MCDLTKSGHFKDKLVHEMRIRSTTARMIRKSLKDISIQLQSRLSSCLVLQ